MTDHLIDDERVEDYLRRLRAATADLPATARAELLADVSQHIRDARAAEADLADVLAELGSPEEIARAAGGRTRSRRTYDRVTIALLALGGLLPGGLGWIAGVVMLWRGAQWTVRDKLLGTFLLPFGPAGATNLVWLNTGEGVCEQVGRDFSCRRESGSLLLVVMALYALIGAATCVYLAGRARRRPA